MKLTEPQIDLLRDAAKARGKRGIYTMDLHYRATTFESLRRRGLLGHYILPQKWMAQRYKITPAGRRALAAVTGARIR